eukprot:1188698-Prorocentrum_minimum.AAC.6
MCVNELIEKATKGMYSKEVETRNRGDLGTAQIRDDDQISDARSLPIVQPIQDIGCSIISEVGSFSTGGPISLPAQHATEQHLAFKSLQRREEQRTRASEINCVLTEHKWACWLLRARNQSKQNRI